MLGPAYLADLTKLSHGLVRRDDFAQVFKNILSQLLSLGWIIVALKEGQEGDVLVEHHLFKCVALLLGN